ncbi:MAG: hypothetical protein SPJ62_16345 [Inconstantimicrobium porci]|uniref:hypothetical protein n=1 Tax=Inconstantimicrobium porci TaxID=2652291 RepID=UPI002A913D29|nr:hypothetical protein [Inconstantimicrobium porci]MDY5913536.1 hypothetical protein [Inconstantimicrobium porci]
MFIENNNLRKSLGMKMAADDGAGSGSAGTGEESSGSKEEGEENSDKEEKTFTQADVDKLIKERLAREKKGQPSKEDLKAFKEWQDNQKTNEEKNAEKITAAETKVKEAEERANTLEAKVSALSKGVKADSVDDVITLAKAMVDDDTPIDKAIDKVLKKYPSFKGEQQSNKGFKVGSGGDKGNPKDTDDELKKIFGIK